MGYLNTRANQNRVSSIRIHDLRPTFASLLLQQEEFLAYGKEQMGHHSIQVTIDTYGHFVPGGNRQTVNGLGDPNFQVPEGTFRNPGATDPKTIVSTVGLSV